MDENRKCCGLLRRRQCWAPTWRGWALLFLSLGILSFIGCRTIHPFLAVNAPVAGGVLVIEGWGADYVMEEVIAEFNRKHYDKIYVTGGPMEYGAPLAAYHTFAEAGAATLLKLGLSSNVVQAVPAPLVRKDRTYGCAAALSRWFRGHGGAPASIQLVTVGPHARRSRLMFEKALGKDTAVGVISIPEKDYDQQHWWRSSAGVRTVIGETMAYLYARFLFTAPEERVEDAP
jgi:hypothetical protein